MKNLFLIIIVLMASCSLNKAEKIICIDNLQCKHVVDFNSIQNKKNLQGKCVVIEGYFVGEFENVALFESRFKARQRHYSEALWVSSSVEFVEKLSENDLSQQKLDGNYVIIKGYLDFSKKGHFNQYAGEIIPICMTIK